MTEATAGTSATATGKASEIQPGEMEAAKKLVIEASKKHEASGSTNQIGGVEQAVEHMHPEYILRAAKVITRARTEGVPEAHMWSMYRSPDMGANPGYADRSVHARGGASDRARDPAGA